MSNSLQPLDLRDALNTKPESIDFVLPGLVAGSVGLIASPGGTGKTFLILQMAASIATGMPVAGGAWPAPDHTGPVAVLAGEDPPLLLRHRLHALASVWRGEPDFDPNRLETMADQVEVYPLTGQLPTVQGSDGHPGPFFDHLRQIAQDKRLVIIDPLRRFTQGDENDSGAMTQLVQMLEAVCQETGTTIVLTHHTAKGASLNGQTDQQQAARGSSALVDGCRWAAYLAGMTPQEAQQFEGVDPELGEHRYFVRMGISKINAGAPVEEVWLRRLSGGPLSLTTLMQQREGRHARAV